LLLHPETSNLTTLLLCFSSGNFEVYRGHNKLWQNNDFNDIIIAQVLLMISQQEHKLKMDKKL